MEHITEGNWEVIDAPDMERVFIYANSEKMGCLVCQLDNSSMPKEEKLANARLIVQSPKMACLLERLIDDGWSASISDEAEEILFSIEEGK